MAVIASGTTFDLPNFVGELFKLTPADTPFLSMIGGLTGGRSVATKEFTWQTVDNAAAAQPSTLEGDEPTYAERSRSELKNVLQVFQYGWQVSYTKLMSTALLGTGGASPGTAATSILGNQPVQNEDAFQAMLKLERAARDVEYTFLQGAFQDPNTNASARRTRGILTAITTNSVAAGSTALDKDKIDQVLKDMYDSGAPFRMPVIFVNSFQKQKISGIYGYAPEHRNIGGVNIQQIETDFGLIGVVLDRHMPAASLLVADVSVCRPVFGTIPDKGHFFIEEMAKTHAAVRKQLYGEIGLEYGPEQWHGEITGLTTS